MNLDLVVHKQLNARDILVKGDKWKELYDFFQEGIKKYGIYFYTYKKNPVPFYVGKCTAKSFNILGRVWDELDDLDRGSSWLGKDVSLLEDFDEFNEGDSFTSSLNPWKRITGRNLKNRIKRFLDYLEVTFAYLDIDEESRILDKILTDIEIIFQTKLLERKCLSKNWIDSDTVKNPGLAKEYNFNVIYKMEDGYLRLDDSLFR